MLKNRLENGFEGGSAFPKGYNSAGKSLYYDGGNLTRESRLLYGQYLSGSQILRLGQPEELELCGEFLEEYIRTQIGQEAIPAYIFDDHNHVLFAWCEALKEGRIKKGATLFHFDYHPDDAEPKENFCGLKSLKKVAAYSRSIDCGSFIRPALSAGLIDSVYWIKSWREGDGHFVFSFEGITKGVLSFIGTVGDIQSLFNANHTPEDIIIDIDMDYFEPIKDLSEERIALGKLRDLTLQAGVITIATSPWYISSRRAIRLTKELLKS